MNWDDFRFFQAVKVQGSLKNAAKVLGTDQATVGRRLYALEDRLGTKLFEKRSNGFFLTPSGEGIARMVDEIEEKFDHIGTKLLGKDQRLQGPVRIAAPGGLANYLLKYGLKRVTELYPEIELNLLTGPEVLNLSKREADLAIRFVKPEEQNLHLTRLADWPVGLYGSKDFWKRGVQPKCVEELLRYPFVGLYPEVMMEKEEKLLAPFHQKLKYVVSTHAWEHVYEAVKNGIGWGALPEAIASRAPHLERIRLIAPQNAVIWMVTHADVRKNARVQAVARALRESF